MPSTRKPCPGLPQSGIAKGQSVAPALRSVVWKLWKTGRRRYAELRKRGVSRQAAILMARAPHGPWHISRTQAMNQAYPDAFWAALGLPRLEPH